MSGESLPDFEINPSEGQIVVKVRHGIVRLYHSETNQLLLEKPITPAFNAMLRELAARGLAQRQDLN